MQSPKFKRMRAPRLAAAAVAALTTALAAAACGSSNTADTTGGGTGTGPATVTRTITVDTGTTTGENTAPASTVTTGTASTPPTSTSTTQTQTQTTGTSTSSTSGGSGLNADACVAADLTPVSEGSNGAAGTIIWTVGLKNTGNSPCKTYGWPGAQFLDSSGKPIGQPATRTTTTMASGTVHPTSISLNPGDTAHFYIQVNDAAGGGAGCTNASYLQIYAPDDTTAMRLATSQQIQYCPKTTVTPLQSGTGS